MGRTVYLCSVKGPLIPFEEHHVQCPHGIREVFRQKFPHSSVGTYGNVPWQSLLIAAGDVPAEFGGGNTVLPLGSVGKADARFQQQ